jgi:hypothetical protein
LSQLAIEAWSKQDYVAHQRFGSIAIQSANPGLSNDDLPHHQG